MAEREQDRGDRGSGAAVIEPADEHEAGGPRHRGDDSEPGPPAEGRGTASDRPDEPDDDEGPPPDDESQDERGSAGFTEDLRGVARDHRGAAVAAGILLLLLLVAALAGTGVAIWAYREAERADKAEQEAVEEKKKAEEVAERYKGRFRQSEATWKATIAGLRHAQAEAEDARRSEEETKAILDFFRKRMLAAGRPGGGSSLSAAFWAAGLGHDVTLRKALDECESRVAEEFGDRPRAEAAIREMLGLGYLNVGEPEPAVRQYERALALREAVQGDTSAETASCRNQLAVAYRLAGRADDAGRLFDVKPESPAHAAALAVRGMLLLRQKKPAEAELRLRESLKIRRKYQPDDWTTFETESLLGEALMDQEKYAEAERLLLSGYKGMKQREDAIPPQEEARLARARERLVKFYEARGDREQARKWREQPEAIAADQGP